MGHSGTSWCTSLFAAAGFDLGHDLHILTERQGYEWRPAMDLIVGAGVRMGGHARPDCHYWWRIDPSRYEAVRSEVKPRFAEMDWPEVVKIPGAFASLFWDFIDPGHVVLVVRDPYEWARSTQANGYMRQAIPMADRPEQYRALVDDILASLTGRPHSVLPFEDAIADAQYAYQRIGFLFDASVDEFVALHARVTHPEWVGLNAQGSGV